LMGERASVAWASRRAKDNGVAEKPFDEHPRGVAAWTERMQVEWGPMHGLHELQPFTVWSEPSAKGPTHPDECGSKLSRRVPNVTTTKGRSAEIANPPLRV
jgi:hypothetical protein